MSYRLSCCIITFLTIFTFANSYGQYQYWHRIFDGQGEAVGVNPVNSNTIYSENFSSQLVASHDGGKTWGAPLSGIQYQTREILVHPRDTNVIFCVDFFNGLIRSSDGGLSWTTVLAPFGIDGVSVEYDPQHPDTLFAGNFSDASVYRSIDRGLTWTLRGHASDGNLCTIVVRPDSSNVLLCGAGGGRISKSTDYGATWRYVKSGGSVEIPRIVIDGSHPNIAYACAYDSPNPNDLGVWKTTDGGETWGHTGLLNLSVWSLDMDQQHPDTIYAGSFSEYNAGVWRTTDGGVSWTLLTKGFYPYNSMWNMRVDQNNPENVYIAATVDAFGFLGTFKLADADAGVQGTVRDSLTTAPLNNGIVRLEPAGDYVDLAYTGGTFEFYRPLSDTVSSYTLNYYVGGTLVQTKPVVFQHGAVISLDLLYTRGVIQGTVFSDLNGDGIQQGGEPGVQNWRITLSGGASAIAYTDITGHYQFTGLAYGSYTVAATHKYGYTATTSAIYNVTVTAGAKSFAGRDFGSRQASTVSAVSPSAYAASAMPSTSVAVTFPEAVNPATFNDSTSFIVRGSGSGRHRGTIMLTAGNTVATFTPDVQFRNGEQVVVDLTSNIHVQSGNFAIAPYTYRFSIASSSSAMSFAGRQDYAVGTSPWGIAAGDVNGDGYNDIVLTNFSSGTMSVLLNNGKGGFPARTDYTTPLSPRCIALADVDGDGDLDIVTGQGAQNVSVFFNNGSGVFGGRTEYSGNGSVYALLLEDVDGDGDIDIITTSTTSDLVSVLKNNGNGTFAASVGYNAAGAPWGACAADFNGDGGVDILVADAGTSSTMVPAENLGGGEFAVSSSYATGGFSRCIVGGDFNGDGLADVAASNNTSGSVSLYTNLGAGVFGGRNDVAVGTSPWGIAAGDVDGDGVADIVTANQTTNTVTVLRNNGGGSFTPLTLATGTAPRMVVLADVDGDGRLDIIVTNGGSGNITVMTNASATQSYLGDGWNMVSAPMAVPVLLTTSLYPGASSSAFGYANGYQQKDTLAYGSGYWIKFTGADTVTFIGNPIAVETVSVNAKWNLVGSVSSPVAVGAVTSIPPGLIQLPFYGYGSGYTAADSLRPGRGYWVKVSAGGKLVIASGSAAPVNPAKAAVMLPDAQHTGSVTIRDNAGSEQTLYLTVNTDTDPSQLELPPPPPAGAFDARFASGSSVAKAGSVERILLHDAQYPVTVSWNIPAAAGTWSLSPGNIPVVMNSTGSQVIPAAPTDGISVRYTADAHGTAPEAFALHQNYPNPFNPSTVINYAVKEQSTVTVKVHDVLGREVAVLVNTVHAAGNYSVTWNAGESAGGVYYVTLTATDPAGKPLYHETRKMALIR